MAPAILTEPPSRSHPCAVVAGTAPAGSTSQRAEASIDTPGPTTTAPVAPAVGPPVAGSTLPAVIGAVISMPDTGTDDPLGRTTASPRALGTLRSRPTSTRLAESVIRPPVGSTSGVPGATVTDAFDRSSTRETPPAASAAPSMRCSIGASAVPNTEARSWSGETAAIDWASASVSTSGDSTR